MEMSLYRSMLYWYIIIHEPPCSVPCGDFHCSLLSLHDFVYLIMSCHLCSGFQVSASQIRLTMQDSINFTVEWAQDASVWHLSPTPTLSFLPNYYEYRSSLAYLDTRGRDGLGPTQVMTANAFLLLLFRTFCARLKTIKCQYYSVVKVMHLPLVCSKDILTIDSDYIRLNY